jgi:hypothetical protein
MSRLGEAPGYYKGKITSRQLNLPEQSHTMEIMPSLLDPALEKTLNQDKKLFAQTELPIVTVSATFREDLKAYYGLPDDNFTPDVVLSRAHYSMALAIALTAWGKRVDPDKAWIIDPTNYVSSKDWQRVIFTEQVGKTLARWPLLKHLKDLVDQFGRSKLPILGGIMPPLLHLTAGVDKAILSLHIAAGNILIEQGKAVVQVVTDPHVREEYLLHADRRNMHFCVFDEATQLEFLEKAAALGKKIDYSRVIVTGPPIDPRIIAARRTKNPWRSGPLKLCITTGGLGTNKAEIKRILEQLLPLLRKRPNPIQLMVYAGTQHDIAEMVQHLARKYRISIDPMDDIHADLRLLYHPQIVDANEMLVEYGFPWADCFITKPSGDMAYDAAAAGCCILTLQEWGVWEHNIRERFEQLGISRAVQLPHMVEQLQVLMSSRGRSQSWIETAMHAAFNLDRRHLHGAENIITVAKSL